MHLVSTFWPCDPSGDGNLTSLIPSDWNNPLQEFIVSIPNNWNLGMYLTHINWNNSTYTLLYFRSESTVFKVALKDTGISLFLEDVVFNYSVYYCRVEKKGLRLTPGKTLHLRFMLSQTDMDSSSK